MVTGKNDQGRGDLFRVYHCKNNPGPVFID
jgi:hypothetical protein